MKIYHKVNIIETNSPKKLYEIFSDKGGKFENR